MVQLLLEHKADTEVRVGSDNREYGWTVLFEPVGKGKVDVARLLLDRGANLNAEGTTGIRPVHWAVIQNAPATLKLLLERKAEINVRDTGDSTPLHYALEYPILPNVEALLDAGADANARGWNGGEETNWPPLRVAVRPDVDRSPAAVVDLLLKHGADVNARRSNGPRASRSQANRADLASSW
jgi:ankyrin repeat protein